jgi:hypothetical protein
VKPPRCASVTWTARCACKIRFRISPLTRPRAEDPQAGSFPEEDAAVRSGCHRRFGALSDGPADAPSTAIV